MSERRVWVLDKKIATQKGNPDLHCEQINWKEENSALDLV